MLPGVPRAAAGAPVTGAIEMGRGSYHAGDLAVRGYVDGEGVTIGRYCSIAPGVTFLAGGAHRTSLVSTWPFDPLLRGTSNADSRTYKHQRRTVVGHDVWISTGAVLMAGITIGNGAVIGPYAVVFDDVPSYTVLRGNPAYRARRRFDDEVCVALQAIAWWGWEPAVIASRVEDFYGPVAEFVEKYRNDAA